MGGNSGGGGKPGRGGGSGGGGGEVNVSGSSFEVDAKESEFIKLSSLHPQSKLAGLSKDDVEWNVKRAAKDIKRQEMYLAEGTGHKRDLESAKAEHRVWSEVLSKGAYGPNAKKFKFKY